MLRHVLKQRVIDCTMRARLSHGPPITTLSTSRRRVPRSSSSRQVIGLRAGRSVLLVHSHCEDGLAENSFFIEQAFQLNKPALSQSDFCTGVQSWAIRLIDFRSVVVWPAEKHQFYKDIGCYRRSHLATFRKFCC